MFTGTLTFDLSDDQFVKLQEYLYRKGCERQAAIEALFPVGITRERALYDLAQKNKAIKNGSDAKKRPYAPIGLPASVRGEVKRKAKLYGTAESEEMPWRCTTRISHQGARCLKRKDHEGPCEF
jgi:hypothetical protein